MSNETSIVSNESIEHSNEDNEKPNSVIGIYYDRHFELITSLEVFYKLYDILDAEYEKYYNNLYE